MLPYLLSGGIERDAMNWREKTELSDGLSVRIERGTTAVQLLPDTQSVQLSNKATLTYDRLIVATGARAVLPDIPGVGFSGVFGLRSLRDAEEIVAAARSAQRAIVLGGGNVGLQAAEALSLQGIAVTIIVRSPHLLSQMVDEDAAQRVQSLFASNGVVIRTSTDVAAIMGQTHVTGVRLENGEELQAGLVIVGKGIEPQIEWLRGSGLRIGRGIIVDSSCRTNIENVFAAGDCAESVDPITGEYLVSGIWPVAHEMGYVAGSNAVGVARTIPGALRMNASTFFSVPIVTIGIVKEATLADAEAKILADDGNRYRKLIFRGRSLVGAVLYGDISGAGTFYRLYRERTEIDDTVLRQLTDTEAEPVLFEYVQSVGTRADKSNS
jgi:NAD(P)H-nitrite reductase large subunit